MQGDGLMASNSTHSARVMIVDDDSLLHKTLTKIIALGGHKVVLHAYNGQEAVDKYLNASPRPSVIIMDFRLPVLNGLLATEKIIDADKNANILLISADESIKKEAFKAGAKGFLTKPIRSGILLSKINEQDCS